MSDIVIKVEHLYKEYRLGVISHGTLSRDLQSWWARMWGKEDPNSRIQDIQSIGNITADKHFWALKDISFDVRQSEVVGIIGRNGAGKSTLLKILSRVTAPTKGTVKIKGRIASLLEVGTGFHPELTGRENVYLNGAILGMTKREIDKKFDEIVMFAEIERFIDTPVKRYSSGMYVRLAFAVAAHLDPEILIVDEVLAVGDIQFQKKCLGKMEGIAHEGRTVLFVSHNLGAIQSLCRRAILLNEGNLVKDGNPVQVVNCYIDQVNQLSVLYKPQCHSKYGAIIIGKAFLKNNMNEVQSAFEFGDDLHIEIHYNALRRIQKPHFWICIQSAHGNLFCANMLIDGIRPDFIEGEQTITCIFGALPLLPKIYSVWMGIREENGIGNLMPATEIASFSVIESSRNTDIRSEVASNFYEVFSSVVVPYAWSFSSGEVIPVNGFRLKGNRDD